MRLANLLNRLFDVTCVVQNTPQTIDHFRAVTNVAFHDVHRVIEDFINGHRHCAVDRITRLLGSVGFLGNQKLERVKCKSNITGENLQKLKIAVSECGWFWAFDVDGAEYLIVQNQGGSQGTS